MREMALFYGDMKYGEGDKIMGIIAPKFNILNVATV